MQNSRRMLCQSVARYCKAHAITLSSHCYDWVLTLEKGALRHAVFGYDLGLNCSSASQLARDKCATSQVLASAGLASIPHHLFLHPELHSHIEEAPNWPRFIDYFDRYAGDVVIKNNEGTGGMEVLRARDLTQLEDGVARLFASCRGIALNPFIEIAQELRFVMLDARCLLAYCKERPEVIGDGRSNLAELIDDALSAGRLGFAPDLTDAARRDPAWVPRAGERILLQWRHNLARGARAVRVETSEPSVEAARQLAERAMTAVGLACAAVDVVVTDGRPAVMEINPGIMLEGVARQFENGPAVADSIYHAALDKIFGEKHF